MHVAICFWGLLRSLPFTIQSFKEYVLKPLQQYNITYDIIIHTYQLNGSYSSTRNKEAKVELNISNYHLLEPLQYIYIENQLAFDERINYQLYETYGDPWKNDFQSFQNHMRALNSLYHVTKVVESLVTNHEIHYDGVIFLRPDVTFLHPLPIELLPINDRSFYTTQQHHLPISPSAPMPSRSKPKSESSTTSSTSTSSSDKDTTTSQSRRRRRRLTSHKAKSSPENAFYHNVLYLPDFHRSCQGYEYNDRMAMGSLTYALAYGKKLENAYDYSLTHYLHAEKFTYDHLRNYMNIIPIEISFRFQRIRAKGDIHIRDYEAITPKEQSKLIEKGIFFHSKGHRTSWYLRFLYTFAETLTGYRYYIWNHDDHGNIFCHPQIYIQYKEYEKYQLAFQKYYHTYQQRLQHVQQQQQQGGGVGGGAEGTSASGEKGSEDTVNLSQYLHHKQKYSSYAADNHRRIRCEYQMIQRSVNPTKHVRHATASAKRIQQLRREQQQGRSQQPPLPPPRNYSDGVRWNVSDANQFITSYLIPVNCTIITSSHLKHHHTSKQPPQHTVSDEPIRRALNSSERGKGVIEDEMEDDATGGNLRSGDERNGAGRLRQKKRRMKRPRSSQSSSFATDAISEE